MESSPELSQDAPREPILTLPGALTAYVLLLAVIHLRVLLPPELENWTVDAFGFIPKRYDSTLLAVAFPGGAGAKIWSFVTYSLLHANHAISVSMCCGCCLSAARWRAGSARSGFSHSWR